MIIEHWVILYLFLNGVMCYMGGSEEWDPSEWAKGFIAALFATPILTIFLLKDSVGPAIKWLDSLVQFRTFWLYVFDRKKLITDRDTLDAMHRTGSKHRGLKTIRAYMYRRAEALVMKVNNYTPKP